VSIAPRRLTAALIVSLPLQAVACGGAETPAPTAPPTLRPIPTATRTPTPGVILFVPTGIVLITPTPFPIG